MNISTYTRASATVNCLRAVPPWKQPLILLGAAALAGMSLHIGWAAEAPPRPPLAGTWHATFRSSDATEVRTRLRLRQDGTNLMGTSIFRAGSETSITNGTAEGGRFRFEVQRERDGESVLTRYEGKVEGDFMKGTARSEWSGGILSSEFDARRYSGIEGTWKWEVEGFGNRRGGRPFEVRLQLKLEDGQLSGSLPSFGGRRSEIKEASFQDGQVKFEVSRGQGERQSVQHYSARLEGDSLRGTITTVTNDEERVTDWLAKRDD